MLFHAVVLERRAFVPARLANVSGCLLLSAEKGPAELVLAPRIEQVTVDLQLTLVFERRAPAGKAAEIIPQLHTLQEVACFKGGHARDQVSSVGRLSHSIRIVEYLMLHFSGIKLQPVLQPPFLLYLLSYFIWVLFHWRFYRILSFNLTGLVEEWVVIRLPVAVLLLINS